MVRGKPFLGGRVLSRKGSETVPSCWGQTESGVLDGINSNSNHLPTPGQPHVDWSIGVGVRFSSPPPTCRWWSAGKYRTTSTPEDTGQPEEAMKMGVISDPQILRSDRNFVSMPVSLAKVAQISQGM